MKKCKRKVTFFVVLRCFLCCEWEDKRGDFWEKTLRSFIFYFYTPTREAFGTLCAEHTRGVSKEERIEFARLSSLVPGFTRRWHEPPCVPCEST